MRFEADTHSHSLMSGHAYSTIREMAAAAKKKGLKAMALTEHAPNLPGTCGLYYFQNLDVVPREMEGVRMLFGAEVNILDLEGHLDLPTSTIKELDIVIASMHVPCYGLEHTKEENTKAYIEVMKKPYVHIIGHPDDGRFPVDYEAIVKMAKETNTLLELNNSSLRPASFREGTHENALKMLEYCKQYEVPITTGSDAHVDVDAGNFCYVEELLKESNFPEELVMTTNWEKLRKYFGV